MLARECRQYRGQARRRDRRQTGDGDTTAAQRDFIAQVEDDRLQFGDRALGANEKMLARRRQPDATRRAAEQGDAEIDLEIAHVRAQCRL